jgi:hypothetical protein
MSTSDTALQHSESPPPPPRNGTEPECRGRCASRPKRASWRRIGAAPERAASLSLEDTERMLHELRVHQIELEMQNEELRQAQALLDTERARYFDLYDLAPVGYCTLSDAGLILQAT